MFLAIKLIFPILSKQRTTLNVLLLRGDGNSLVFSPEKYIILLLLFTEHLNDTLIVLISVDEYSQFSLFNVIF